ncbi:hypothetical protein NBRC116495_16650 [Aurantivibrio plasticivorans]
MALLEDVEVSVAVMAAEISEIASSQTKPIGYPRYTTLTGIAKASAPFVGPSISWPFVVLPIAYLSYSLFL